MKGLLTVVLVLVSWNSAFAWEFTMGGCTEIATDPSIDRNVLENIKRNAPTGSSSRDCKVNNINWIHEGSPSKEFVDEYNPKKIYCIKCQTDCSGEMASPTETKAIALVTQNGDISFFDHTPKPVDEFEIFWDEVCPISVCRFQKWLVYHMPSGRKAKPRQSQ